VTPVSGALKRAYHAVLRKRLQVFYGERDFVADESVHSDFVGGGVKVWNRTMVAVVTIDCNEAVTRISIATNVVQNLRVKFTSKPISVAPAPDSTALRRNTRAMTSSLALV
jgi:hypothetical protein